MEKDVDGMEDRCQEKTYAKQRRVQSNWLRTLLQISTEPTEVIVRICGMLRSVVGVAGNAPGLPNESDNDMPSTSSKRQTSPNTSTPKRPSSESTGERLKKFLDENNDRKLDIHERLDDLVHIEKENASSLR
ncbi:uncharacterized protein LOC110117689 [Ceratitis capitata]|uniref:uncharacterized protein LOC110117689 n=1 Tax=Ceratitis capitata TaxID=7213 RepID=UPI000A1064D7|nr:uncharacterized protein LOC110117689 [Ceratitis capitata]